MGTTHSKAYTTPPGLEPLNQAFLSLVHQVDTSVLGTTPSSQHVRVPRNHLVVDPCSVGNASSTKSAKGVSGAIYKFGRDVWGPIDSFSEEATAALKHTGDGHYATYGGRHLAHVVSPSFAWYKGGDVTFRHRNPTRHVVDRLASAYSRALQIFLDPACTETVLDCVPFAWGVNAGFWSRELPVLTLHALSQAIGSLTADQRGRLGQSGDKRFNLCFYLPDEQAAMGRALTRTKFQFGD
jgi:hypothetical protein